MKLRYPLSALFICTFVAGLAMRGGMWGYEECWIPRRPLAWQHRHASELSHLQTVGGVKLMHFVSPDSLDSQVVLNGTMESHAVRSAIYRHGVTALLVHVAGNCQTLPLTVICSADPLQPPIRIAHIPTEREIVQAIEVAAKRRARS